MTSKLCNSILLSSLLILHPVAAAETPFGAPQPLAELSGLSMPSDVVVGEDGSVYVVDGGNHQVAVFDARGQKRTTLGMLGSAEGQFQSPVGIGLGADGELWVADKGNRRLVMFDAGGRPVRTFGLKADGEDLVPVDVAVGPDGSEVFVTANNTHQVVVFSDHGEFLRSWGGEGDAAGQFRFPATIAIDAAGNVYVVDVLNARVQKFDAMGKHLLTIGERGGRAGTFFRPKGVAVDVSGNVYVSDSFLGVVQVFDAKGTLRYVLGENGAAVVYETPVGLAVRGRRLYVTQMLPGRVTVLEPLVPSLPAVAEASE